MTTIQRGHHVVVVTADGKHLHRRAVSGVEQEGHDFPIVWVTSEEEWAEADEQGRLPEAWPWPAEDVKVVEVA